DYGARYPEAERIFDLDTEETLEKLDSLYEKGFLRRSVFSNVMKCPSCDEYSFVISLRCPHCNSRRIERGEVLEHYDCGHQGFKEDFLEDDSYVCPRCGEELEQLGVDFRRAGLYYKCIECEEFFGNPVEIHICSMCEGEFELNELVFKTVWSYSGDPERVKSIVLGVEIDKISEALEEHGSVDIFGSLKGKSGVDHTFSIVFNHDRTNGRIKAVDIKLSDKIVPMGDVTSFYAKVNDIKEVEGILVAIPKLSEEARNLAESFDIKLIERKNTDDISKVLEKVLLG
ncbi:hypothetical protein GF319_07865, partial [Candidatus Bathyarchaeota archaeon]|nr:hypothetical protein [Candidatus Bathyarchaeota archaeon]